MCCISDSNSPKGHRFITVDAATAERARRRSTAQVPTNRNRHSGASGGTSRRHSRSTQTSSPRTERRSPRVERRGRRDSRPETPVSPQTRRSKTSNPNATSNKSTAPSNSRHQRGPKRTSHPTQNDQNRSVRAPSPPGEEIVEPPGSGNRRTSRTFYTVGENGVEMLARTEYDPVEPEERQEAEPVENQPGQDENAAEPADNGTESAAME